ncbi:hypothetical protein K2652_002307 [Salmonella enterica subsp. enterica serovar Agbeni]|nr:hypothetical protein [Salmonella enterica subsp. enterica serovar Agbeni]EHW4351840.1 hypothetical protein [Salmonella enterica subsp. enterica serovar Agbeni]
MSAPNKLAGALVVMFAASPASWPRAPTLLEIELMARELRECRRSKKRACEQITQLRAQLERYQFMERARQTSKTEGRE